MPSDRSVPSRNIWSPPVASAIPSFPSAEAPRRRDLPVVEDRLAHELDLDLPFQAQHRPDQHVIGVVVGRRTRVGRDVVLALARSHRERVAHDHPAARRLPRGHEHVGPRLVGDLGRHVDAERTEPERAGLPVQQAAEDARRVEPRDAQPVDRAVRRDEGSRVTVGQERVVGDRRERRRHRRALCGRVRWRRPRLTGSSTARATCRSPRRARRLPRAPTSPARTGGRAAAHPAAAGTRATSPRPRPAA